jgi:hypothetical protein
MNKSLFIWFGLICTLLVLWHGMERSAYGQQGSPSADHTQFLPAIFLNSQSGGTIPPVATATTSATAQTPTATATAVPTETPTATPTLVQVATATATATSAGPTATATATPTAISVGPTATATATPTATSVGPTPTATATSIPFPDVTFACQAEPASGDALRLIIQAELSAPAPFGGASFRLNFTDEAGPIDDILRPLPFQLINFFSGDTVREATGFLSKCDQVGQCTATYTVAETNVTRYIDTTVDCQY